MRNIPDTQTTLLTVYRWHADIKPDNILWVKNESFKLADPGFAVFVEKVDGAEAETELKGGTQAYGAPECSITKKFGLVRQTIVSRLG